MKLSKLEVPLFKCGDIYLCRNENELKAFHKKFKLPYEPMGNRYAGFATTIENEVTGDRNYLISIADMDFPTIAHEASHVAFYICRDTGVEVNVSSSNETFCYLVTAIVDFIYKNIEKPA